MDDTARHGPAAGQEDGSMEQMVLRRMEDILYNHVDDVADVLRIDVGEGDAGRKLARLFAAVLMDAHKGTRITDPGHFVQGAVEARERGTGERMPLMEQELLAAQALEYLLFWDGMKWLTVLDLLERVLLYGQFPLQNTTRWISDSLKAFEAYDADDYPDMTAQAEEVAEAKAELKSLVKGICGTSDLRALKPVINAMSSSDSAYKAICEAHSVLRDACGRYDDMLRRSVCDVCFGGRHDISLHDLTSGNRHETRHEAVSSAMRYVEALDELFRDRRWARRPGTVHGRAGQDEVAGKGRSDDIDTMS